MIKITTLFLFFLFPYLLLAQNFKEIKLEVLSTQLSYANGEITTRFDKGKMYYYDAISNQKLFAKGVDVAYPFFLKSAVVKEQGKYGIIDKDGNFLVEPIYDNFELPPYEHECYIVIFNETVIFDLNTGADNASYTICEELAFPELHSYMSENMKYGVKNEGEIIVQPIYDTIYVVERQFSIVSKNKKIGLLDAAGNPLTPFEYDETNYSIEADSNYTYPIFGLRKNNKWTYFENGQRLLESSYKCSSFLTMMENDIGIFTLNGKENILFKNGKTLNKYYDSISENGLVGVIDNTLFIINNDGSDSLYYQEN